MGLLCIQHETTRPWTWLAMSTHWSKYLEKPRAITGFFGCWSHSSWLVFINLLVLDLMQQRFISPFFLGKKLQQPLTFLGLCNQSVLELAIDMDQFTHFPFENRHLFLGFSFEGHNIPL
jgi:hypothetical protein